MTTTDPRHALRLIVDMIDRDAPREELRAATDRMVGAWADEFFGWARNRPESDIFGAEVFFEDTPDKRWWVLCTEGDDEVTLIGADGRIGRWDCDQLESLLVRPGGTRLAVPPVPRGWDQRRMDELAEGLSQGWQQRAGNGIWQRVTRLDVIRPLPDGRSSETADGVEWALQDDGRTLKIWTDGRWRDRQEGASYE